MRSPIHFKAMIKHLPLIGTALLYIGCQPDKIEERLPSNTTLQASFTVTPVQGNGNKFFISNTTPEAIATRWDLGKGAGWTMGKFADTVFYPDAGTYSIKMQALNKAGVLYDAPAPKTITVATSDPAYGNLLQGSKFKAGDESYWTVVKLNTATDNNGKWTFTDGKATVTGSGNNAHTAMYQAIQVEAGRQYQLSMTISGGGASNCWFEVYLGTAAPVAGSDYSNGGNMISMNTWSGCGTTTFSGNLASIGCAGTLKGKNGLITFTQSGTRYLVIKCGCNGGGTIGSAGITVTNIDFRGI